MKKGFTLIELMVSITIVGVLMALALVAINRVRESSRRAQCFSNMKNVGTALHSFYDARNQYPPASEWSTPGEPLGNNRYPIGVIDRVTATTEDDRLKGNWCIYLLPFSEEQSVYDNFDSRKPLHEQEMVYSVDIPFLKCPSDGYNTLDNHYQRSFTVKNKGYARANYALNAGTNKACMVNVREEDDPPCPDGWTAGGNNLEINNSQLWGSGIGGVNKTFRNGDFPSGLSNVVAFDEVLVGRHEWDRRGAWALGFAGASITAVHGGGPNGGADEITGCSKIPVSYLRDLPCSPVESNMIKEVNMQGYSRSAHPGGVCVLLLDGSVKFIDDDIDKDLWREIHRRDSSKIIE
ncbi:MAG: DUF1559 domain-containing protein [Crenarchaeota archaeon]|nr:MAG: DUF1559 domain-containing protein [Thermoproteota archaeon]